MRSVVLVFLVFIGVPHVAAQQLTESILKLRAIEKGGAAWNPDGYLKISTEAMRRWSAATASEKERFADRLFLVHFRRAEIFASRGNYAEARRELVEEAQLQRTYSGRLEYSTRASDLFFSYLAKLHVAIADHAGSDPLAGVVDYLFQKVGDEYIVAREEMDREVNGVMIAGVDQSESVVQAHYLRTQGGQVILQGTRWFIGPKGSASNALIIETRAAKLSATNMAGIH